MGGGKIMRHARKRSETGTEFYSWNLCQIEHFQNLDVDGRLALT